MVTNFEEITRDLNERDMLFEPFVCAVIRGCVEERNAKKGSEIVSMVNYKVATEYDPKEATFNEVRLRKFVNYYRTNGLMPVCSTAKGYFISFENKILQSQIKSLTERANSIMIGAKGLQKWIK